MKREAMLYDKRENNVVHCHLCSHHCKIAESNLGFCGVRRNIDGTLYTLVYGETIANHVDPIEKKPLFHFLPGTRSYSIAAVGCNFHCGFCQNWQISQITEQPGDGEYGISFPPRDVVAAAKEEGCASISYTYTEPTIYFEYAYDTAKIAAEEDLKNVFVTNGYMTKKTLEVAVPYLDAVNVDLKAWQENYYRTYCKASLKPVLEAIRAMRKAGIWVEVTTLVVPGENDSTEALEGIARFIADVDPEIPWHISRFHPSYRFGGHSATPMETLETAEETGRRSGLRYVYLGNAPSDTTTYCPKCREPIVQRSGREITRVNMDGGRCPSCGTEISGVWG